MDTSKEYIKMCDCEEIQKEKYPTKEFRPSDMLPDETMIDTNGDIYIWAPTSYGRLLWIPRQDQLQEMVLGKLREKYQMIPRNNPGVVQNVQDINREANWFNKIFNNKVEEYSLGSNSMEQLWLAFVMWEKHSAMWTGSEWDRAHWTEEEIKELTKNKQPALNE